jgi:serine/threonine protein kinase
MSRPDSLERTVFSLISKCPNCGTHSEDSTLVCPHDGALLARGLAPGTVIAGRYAYLSTIGSGGMGLIVRAHDNKLGIDVAVKMLLRNSNRSDQLRFKREATAASLLRHENIIKLYDFDITADGLPYMVMEFIEGDDLASELSRCGALDIEKARNIFEQLFDAMSYAHKKGVCHRDLKPSNIMLIKSGIDLHVKIVDFGIAKITYGDGADGADHGGNVAGAGGAFGAAAGATQLTATGQILGSPIYMSPEQALGRPIDMRTDIYSAGCVMFHTLTGAPPITGNTAMETLFNHVNVVPPTMSEASLGIKFSPQLEALVKKSLSKSPEERQQTFVQLQQEFRLAMGESGCSREENDAPIAARKPRFGGRALAISIVAATVCLSSVAYFFIPSGVRESLQAAVTQARTTQSPELPGSSQTSESSESSESSASSASSASHEVTRSQNSSSKEGGTTKNSSAMTSEPDIDMSGFRIDLTGDSIPKAEIERKAKSGASQIDVDATDRSVTDETIKYLVLQFKSAPQRLHSLNFNSSMIDDKGLSELASFGPRLNLTRLALSKTRVSPNGIKIIARLKGLQELDISELKNVENDSLSPLSSLKQLQVLNISRCSTEDSGRLNLDFLLSLPRLKTLICAVNTGAIDDRSVALISRLKNLTFLDLSSDHVSASGVAYLRQLTQLETLRLAGKKYDGSNIGALLAALPNLKHLVLNYQIIDDSALLQISKLYEENHVYLSTLDIYDCPRLSPAACMNLQNSMPNCVVHWGKKKD